MEDHSLKMKFKVNLSIAHKSEQHIPTNCTGRLAGFQEKGWDGKQAFQKKEEFGNEMPSDIPDGFMRDNYGFLKLQVFGKLGRSSHR